MMRAKTAAKSVPLAFIGICIALDGPALSVDSPSDIRSGLLAAATGQPGPDSPQPEDAASIPIDRLRWHLPDAGVSRGEALEALKRWHHAGDQPADAYLNRVLDRVETVHRPRQLSLSLEDAIGRTIENNFTIEVFRYNPAVETTRVIEAEAAFDAIFSTNITKNHVDRPTGSQLLSTQLDQLVLSSGIRKLLPTGATASGVYTFRRTAQNFAFQTINPEYFSSLELGLRQPLLRNFGIDYNRSVIVLAGHERRINGLTFRRQVRDILRQVEERYWRLVQARRDVLITARLLADFEAIYEYLDARKDFDVLPVQLAATKADLAQAEADFIQRIANVFNAQDSLIATMNDPQIDLVGDVEIVPTDFPVIEPIAMDRVAEVQTALDHRTEIREQKVRVASAKIGVGRAVNEELPRFDLTFRVTYDGLSTTADRSFDEMSRTKFIEYFIGVDFEMPIGNRGPRAARRRAELQHSQARAQLQRVFEDVILDVNLAMRQMRTSYDQITPSFESAEAREREVESIVARAERKDFNTLINELNSRQRLAGIRRTMLGILVDYNIAIIDLERAKGTLPEFSNIIIPYEDD